MEENTNNKKQESIVEYVNDFPTEEEERLRIEREKEAEANFRRAQRRSLWKKRIKFILLIVAIILFLIAAYVIFQKFIRERIKGPEIPEKTVKVSIPDDKEYVFANDTSGIESAENDNSSGYAGESENYKIREISVGGGLVVLAAETETLPIEVYDVKTETLFSRDQKETKLLVSWKTNKPARSDVKYAKSGGDKKTLKENSYGFSHALVLNDLEQSARYSFNVEAVDRGGNKAVSNEFVVFTGTKVESVFEMISSEIDAMFGWALKK